MSDPNRADPFDLADFKPTPAKKTSAVPKEILRQISEDNNFPSRAPEISKPQKIAQQRRRRTGRNTQFNIKTTPASIERFTSLADKVGATSFGEFLDKLLDVFEKKQ